MLSNEFLYRRIGQRIEQAYIEAWQDRDGVGSVNAVWLHFSDGKPIILGCAGDGEVFSRKADFTAEQDADLSGLQQELIPFLSGATLEAVQPEQQRLCLRTSRGVVTIHNLDDQLFVEFSDVEPDVA